MTIWLLAGLIGLLAASGLFIGALVGYTGRLPHRLIANVMGFGAGVLVAVLTLELISESGERGSILATAGGFMGGALLFSLGNWLLERRGAAERNVRTPAIGSRDPR
jgi:ZIP family zinc transporter